MEELVMKGILIGYKRKNKVLKKRLDYSERQIKVVQGISKKESELKSSCFSFLIKKGLYDEWERFYREDKIKSLKNSITMVEEMIKTTKRITEETRKMRLEIEG